MSSTMNVARRKIWKASTRELTSLEEQLAKELLDMEASSSCKDIAANLKNLQFSKVVNIEVNKQHKVTVIFVPYRFRKEFQAINQRLTRELSKKLNTQEVIFIAERVILPKNYVRQKGNQQRPRTRTLTSVHKGIWKIYAILSP
eukprot:UN27245